MKIKSEVVPSPAAPSARRQPSAKLEASPTEEQLKNPLLPRNQVERNLVEAIEEMKEVMAGRKQAISMEDFWKEVRGA